MTGPAVTHLTLSRSSRFSIRMAEVYDESTGESHSIPVRMIKGLSLVERSDFVTYIEKESTTNRMVAAGLLTSFHANGTPKQRRNGKLPNNKTYYCLKQWEQADYNQIT